MALQAALASYSTAVKPNVPPDQGFTSKFQVHFLLRRRYGSNFFRFTTTSAAFVPTFTPTLFEVLNVSHDPVFDNAGTEDIPRPIAL
jgi:hypothetical protein